MDYYIHNPGGSDRGPFTLEQLQTKLASGIFDSKTRVRMGASESYRPLSQVIDSPLASDAHVAASVRPFRGSALSGWFIFFAVLDFIAATIGLLMAFMGSGSEVATGVTLFAVGISGGFLFLALAKILDYLGEAVFRLRNLEEFATPKA